MKFEYWTVSEDEYSVVRGTSHVKTWNFANEKSAEHFRNVAIKMWAAVEEDIMKRHHFGMPHMEYIEMELGYTLPKEYTLPKDFSAEDK